jgi:two-component SAPR family response regulator
MNPLTVILIDDEQRALHSLIRILANFPEVRIAATFEDALVAREYIDANPVDGVFVDIEMPEINGLKFAEQLAKLHPHIHVVFTTAYMEHAVVAFELASLDYLLKPVSIERMTKTIARMVGMQIRNRNETFMIRTVPTLVVRTTANGYTPIAWRTEKAKQVFLYLLFHANQPVLRDTLIDIFWDAKEQSKAAGQLHTTVYLIRKQLATVENELQIQSRNSTYTLVVPTHAVDFLSLRLIVPEILSGQREFLLPDIDLVRSFCDDVLMEVGDIWIETYRSEIDLLVNAIIQHIRAHPAEYETNAAIKRAITDLLHQHERFIGTV